MSKYPLCKKADKYARDVVAGKVVACKWIIASCQKHLDGLKAQKSEEHPYYFDSVAAERTLKFVQLMPHTKGKWARERQTLQLEPWQCFFISNVFGWMRKRDNLRRYRRALLWVPRKNGKSAMAAAIANYMFAADNEFGSEVYSGATTEKQAWEVFRPAKLMTEKTAKFKAAFGIEVNASNMNIASDGSKFEPIIGNPGDGSSPHCAIIDEFHEHKDSRMVDTMETGMGAREQPLLLMITTAGDNLSGPCYDMQLDSQKVLEGAITDDTVFSMIFGIDQGDDWTHIKSLKKANPNYGISVGEDFLKAQLQQAKNNARKQSTFKTKHLNVWVGSRDAFYNVEKWTNNADPDLKLEDFKGCRAYLGLDLASRVDIAALEILITHDDGAYTHFSKHYLPEQASEKEVYNGWMRDGFLTLTDGEIIDFNEIKADILGLISFLEVAELAYDPFQATMLITELMEEGVPVVEMRPTVLNFSEPMKELDSLIRSGRIKHNGNPVFTWMLSNVTAKPDKKDNVYPTKERSENKIDGPVALMMALGRAMNGEEQIKYDYTDPIVLNY
jgi:phage terminase large subunit-like protein